MSTEWLLADDADREEFDQTRFVTFGGGRERGVCAEFGTLQNFAEVLAMLECGMEFSWLGDGLSFLRDERGEVGELTADLLLTRWAEGRVTFGEFPATVAVGSDASQRFGGVDVDTVLARFDVGGE